MRSTLSSGSLTQIAYVVDDLEEPLRYWTQVVGVGPFFVREKVQFDRVLHRGQPSSLSFSMALAYWGDTQIELICQQNDAPSIYRDWRDAGLGGVQHVAVFVDDMVRVRQQIAALGGSLEQEVWMPGGMGEAIYADLGGGPGTMIEYVRLDPSLHAGFDAMKRAAAEWDGTDPVRMR